MDGKAEPAYVPTFAELVGDEEEFFASYFNKKPLLREGALLTDPSRVLSTADLDQILRQEAIRPPYFAINSYGESLPAALYTRAIRVHGTDISDIIVPERVYDYFHAGATLTWHAVNHFRPNIRALTQMFSVKFATDCRVTAFLTPADQQGFKPHHDPVDVFAAQLEGRKRWRIWETPERRKGNIADYTLDELGEPEIDAILQPGDVLYVPYDTPHAVTAEGDVSLHLSVLVRPRMWKDLLRLTVDRLLESEEFLEFPHLSDASMFAQSDVLADYASLLVKRLQDINMIDELKRLIAQGRPALQRAKDSFSEA